MPTGSFYDAKNVIHDSIDDCEDLKEKESAIEMWEYHENTWCKGKPFTKVDWQPKQLKMMTSCLD